MYSHGSLDPAGKKYGKTRVTEISQFLFDEKFVKTPKSAIFWRFLAFSGNAVSRVVIKCHFTKNLSEFLILERFS